MSLNLEIFKKQKGILFFKKDNTTTLSNKK